MELRRVRYLTAFDDEDRSHGLARACMLRNRRFA
jgi:hypothetical protein